MSNAAKPLTPVQRRLIIGALAAILIGLGYWWYTTLEWEEKEVDLGYSKEALQNDFLAAEIFLRKHGIQATTVKNLSLLDTHSWRNLKLGAQDTLVIINGYKTLTDERYDTLYEWVSNGGTLITSTQNPFVGAHTGEEDVLLADFDIEAAPEETELDQRDLLEKIADGFDEADDKDAEDQSTGNADDENKSNENNKKSDVEAEESASSEADQNDEKTDSAAKKSSVGKAGQKENKGEKDEKPENYYRCSLDETPTPIEFGGEEKPLHFDFSHHNPFIYYRYVSHNEPTENNDAHEGETPDSETGEEQIAGSSEDGNEAEEDYHYDEEQKHLIYFDVGAGSVTITSDNYIWSNQRIDCHDHAYGLWQLVNANGRVWFLINQDAPSLAAILWRNASYGVIAGISALVLWLWASSLRFGPLLAVEQSGRRSLGEHIYASAMLLWRKQQHPQLLNVLREEIIERLHTQYPNVDQAASGQHIELLHQLTGISAADIKQALFAEDLHHPQKFATAIAHLQTIWKQLSRHHF
ncbi:MAG TPA: DUF4350 domain-containing protein [Cellvibrio sp.]|nr:DUF4350 domain-containing protein [Cellvibrio sp.]